MVVIKTDEMDESSLKLFVVCFSYGSFVTSHCDFSE